MHYFYHSSTACSSPSCELCYKPFAPLLTSERLELITYVFLIVSQVHTVTSLIMELSGTLLFWSLRLPSTPVLDTKWTQPLDIPLHFYVEMNYWMINKLFKFSNFKPWEPTLVELFPTSSASLDPHQYVFRTNRSTEDAISTALHSVVTQTGSQTSSTLVLNRGAKCLFTLQTHVVDREQHTAQCN